MPAVTALLIVPGIWSANKVEAAWGMDSGRIVVDEAAGMYISLLFIPVMPGNVLAGLYANTLLQVIIYFNVL